MYIGVDASRMITGQRTGTEAYAYFLIQALIPLAARRGHQLGLYFNQLSSPDLLPQAAHVELIPIPFPRLWTHIRLAWQLHRRPPDVFFTPAHVIPWSYHGRSVATVHDLGYHYFPAAHPWSQRAYLRWSTRHNGRRSRRVLADSQATREDLARFYAIDPAKIDVVYPGVDPALQPVADQEQVARVMRKYGITPPYLLYLGTIQPRKNLARLVQAHAASGVPHQLVLAGKSGWLSPSILREVEDRQRLMSNGQWSIVLPGFVHEADKAALISGATALLYPSLYEGFGFPVLEAQACGTAVLCARSSSLPEVAGDGALLVDPLDTAAMAAGIRQLCQDTTLRTDLVQRGRTNVRRFTWLETAARCLEVLECAGCQA